MLFESHTDGRLHTHKDLMIEGVGLTPAEENEVYLQWMLERPAQFASISRTACFQFLPQLYFFLSTLRRRHLVNYVFRTGTKSTYHSNFRAPSFY